LPILLLPGILPARVAACRHCQSLRSQLVLDDV